MLIILRIIILYLFIFFWNNFLSSQVTQEWTVRYNGIGNGNDVATSIVTDNQGNIIVTGHSKRIFGTSNSDYVSIKYNSQGIQQWVAIYNGPGNDDDFPEEIVVDKYRNLYVTGWSKGLGLNYDYATVKYNSLGVEQWAARYSGNDEDQARSVAVDSLGNVYITGQSYNNLTRSNCVTIKYNSSGIQQWIANYDNLNNNDEGYAVKNDEYGNVYVAGYSANIGSQKDFITIKYNSSGNQQWIARYDGIMHQTDEAGYLALDDLGNVYVAGLSVGAANYEDYVIIKYNSQGIEQWVRRYNGSSNFIDKVSGIKISQSKNVYVTGYSAEIGTGYDYTTIKYTASGDLIWITRFNYGLNDFPYSICLDNSENIYITGESDGGVGENFDYATVKFDSSGNQKWSKIYSSQGDSSDRATSLVVDNRGNLLVTGYANQQNADYVTIKYSQLTGISNELGQIPNKYFLSQNYPNPFNPKTIIKYNLPRDARRETQDVKLIVYDISGKDVAALVNEKQNAGSHSAEWDGSNYPSGIYFYMLQVDGRVVDTKRMILLK